jgi:hypothetical protein
MRSIPLGETILMLDAGCQLNFNSDSRNRLEYYREIAMEHSGLFMQLQNGQFGIENLSDGMWTKEETLKLLDPLHQFRDSGQIQSGIIFLKNNLETQSFVESWLQNCLMGDFRYLSYDPMQANEKVLGHRWEQSILSLMVKNTNFKYIPDETFFAPDWNTGHDYPIWAMRNRSGGDAYRRNSRDLLMLAGGRIENLVQHRLRITKGFN